MEQQKENEKEDEKYTAKLRRLYLFLMFCFIFFTLLNIAIPSQHYY